MPVHAPGQTWNPGALASILAIGGFDRIVDQRSIPLLQRLGCAS